MNHEDINDYSAHDLNYTEYNDVENNMYTNALLWGITMVTFTYCTVSLLNTFRGVCREFRRDTDLDHRLVETPIDYTPIQYTDIHYTDNEYMDTCSICLYGYKEGESLVKLNCSHIYHKDCLFDWFKKNRNCPMCRLSV
jgi:hypothetical protein